MDMITITRAQYEQDIREAKAGALRDAADFWDHAGPVPRMWLQKRADEVERAVRADEHDALTVAEWGHR